MPNFDALPKKILAPGLIGRYIHGDHLTLGEVTILAGSRLPEHQHPHEQITVILKGRMDMNIGGTLYSMTAGMAHVIPPNTPHSAHAITDCVVLDAFHPVREDYR